MKYDLIMVAASRDRALIDMTQRAIDSCLQDGADVNVILVETHTKHRYRGVNEFIFFSGPFNYNHCLNMGIERRKGDIQILANNDLIFEKGWSEIGEVMKENGILSASALSDSPQHRLMKKGYFAYKGYTIGLMLTGWCTFNDAKIWDKIKKLDESVVFWYSDNVQAEQLKKAGIEHWLLCCAKVNHITSQTFIKMDRKTRQEYIRAPKALAHRSNR